MATKERISLYFQLFHGAKVPMSGINDESSVVKDAVMKLVARGEVVGQHMFNCTPEEPITDTDIILWMPEKI